MPDISKGNVKKERMGGSASRNSDNYLQASNSHHNEVMFAAEERQALNMNRPSRPTPPSRPLPVLMDASSEQSARGSSLKSKSSKKTIEATSSAASSPGVSQRKHTPATIPRTKFTSATPLEQRIAINSLRQKLDYEEKEKDSSSKQMQKAESGAAAMYNDKASVSSVTESHTASQVESETSDVVDTTRIMQRLTQVRDYLKQATSLYVNLSTKVHLEDSEVDHIDKLGKLIQQLRLQEQGYVDLLQRTLSVDESGGVTPSSSVLSLNQEEPDENEENQQQELKRLQMQHALLKKIVEQQQQIQDLKKKQATLASLQEQAEDLMKAADNARDEAVVMNWDEEEETPVATNAFVTTETETREQIDNEESALFDADMLQRKLELENKLINLQAKKEKMDSLLSTLKESRDTIAGVASDQLVSVQGALNTEGDPSTREAELLESKKFEIKKQQENAMEAMQQARNVQAKLQKLKQVKQRLEDLSQIVSEYEQSQRSADVEPRDNLESRSQGNFGGARPRDGGASMQFSPDADTRDMTNGIDNRMRPTPPGGRSQRTAIDVTRNPSSSRDSNARAKVNDATDLEKNLASEDQDNDLSSKIRQLQEARERLAHVQRNAQLLSPHVDKNEQASEQATTPSVTESESESESVSTAEDLSWQEDPEFQAKVRRLQQAKEKLKHLQELVNSVQQDGLAMDELANISVSSKESSINGNANAKRGVGNVAEGGETDEEDAEITSEQQSDDENDDDDDDDDEDDDEDDDDDDDDDEDDASSAVDDEGMNEAASKQSDSINDAVGMLDREIEYQAKLKQQKQELEKLLNEKQKLLDAQQQLSEIAKNTLERDGKEIQSRAQQRGLHPTALAGAMKKPEIKFDFESERKMPFDKSLVEKPGNRVTYKDVKVPRIVKRTSNLSVEPQYGSDSDVLFQRKKVSPQAGKRQPGFPAGSRPNPLVMSELRRQREMFEQNKKLKFVEKQRRKRDSADDNRSDGGTYSIRSDLDEGVGHSMFSADVTTAATWGGSTEQSSSEEDSAVGEDDFPEEIEDEYEGNMDPAEEEDEERVEDDVEDDDLAPLLDFKSKGRTQKKEKTWFSVGDRRGQSQRGKKRKIDAGRNGSSVSWSMNVSPESSARQRQRQQNLTPAHKLMKNRTLRPRNDDNALWEEQCEQLKQQLSSSTLLSTSLLKNQQTLLSMLQNQSGSFGSLGTQGLYNDGLYSHGAMPNAFWPQSSTNHQQQNILQSLERCMNQLDRQHQEIQSLQRDFQSMLLRQSSGNRVYAWEHPTPFPMREYGQSKAASADLDGRYPSEARTVPSFKPDFAHAATSPPIAVDETENRFTQTEFQPKRTVAGKTGAFSSLFDEQSDQKQRNAESFPPFNFHGFKEESKAVASSATLAQRNDERASAQIQSDNSYNPLVYTDSGLASSTKDAGSRSRDVITSSYPTPSKSKAAKNLAQRQKATWPSFFKESENVDSQSEKSLSHYGDGERRGTRNDRLKNVEREADDKLESLSVASNFSLFETMRDSIYSEVATLISMNESRPHYLVELFRELQLLTSDYLRQRALYALQDLVTRFLTEDSEMRQANEPTDELYGKWFGTAVIEQTPSESVATTDDEQQEAKALEALSSQIRNNDMYDYAEIAETGSTMSTPTSNQDPPFAAEGLGDTVINLDEALQKMRSYEERMAEARKKVLQKEDDFAISADDIKVIGAEAANVEASENSSAYDIASETSSELQQPSIDTQKLDRQIKSIMMELIPFLNDHMESKCTMLFLNELNTLIFNLAKQKEPGAEKQEFGRSFHRQLESVLKDSLSRFEGRILKECGEDLLIDVSEILFNELAFFRLMQDLDRPASMLPELFWVKDSSIDHPSKAISGQPPFSAAATGTVPTSQDPSGSSVGYLVNTSGTIFSPPAPRGHENQPEQNRAFEQDGLEIQDLEETDANCSDADDETEASRQFVNVELSVSESRPFASTGSGEEDVEEDQQSFPVQNIPPESSVGAQQQQRLLEQQQHQDNNQSAAEGDDDVDDVDDMPEDEELRSSPRNAEGADFARGNDENISELEEEDERGEDEREEGDRHNDMSEQGDGAAGTDRVVLHPGNEDGDESEVTIDDLPTKLTGLTEADLQTRMQSEQSAVEGAAAILSHLSTEPEIAEHSANQQQQQQHEQQQQPDRQEQDGPCAAKDGHQPGEAS